MIEKKGLFFGILAFCYNLINLTIFSVYYIQNPTSLRAFTSLICILVMGLVIFGTSSYILRLHYEKRSVITLISISVLINVIFSLERLNVISANLALIIYALIVGGIFIFFYKKKASK